MTYQRRPSWRSGVGIPVTSYRTRWRPDWPRVIGLVVTPITLWAMILGGLLL